MKKKYLAIYTTSLLCIVDNGCKPTLYAHKPMEYSEYLHSNFANKQENILIGGVKVYKIFDSYDKAFNFLVDRYFEYKNELIKNKDHNVGVFNMMVYDVETDKTTYYNFDKK